MTFGGGRASVVVVVARQGVSVVAGQIWRDGLGGDERRGTRWADFGIFKFC